mmetsp:Transcript_18799/g.52271  ORF Transcript_18799/g.52271 Transcript_18799/m.52271 type:complete len:205 (-) Transcript_18799:61-675(-)
MDRLEAHEGHGAHPQGGHDASRVGRRHGAGLHRPIQIRGMPRRRSAADQDAIHPAIVVAGHGRSPHGFRSRPNLQQDESGPHRSEAARRPHQDRAQSDATAHDQVAHGLRDADAYPRTVRWLSVREPRVSSGRSGIAGSAAQRYPARSQSAAGCGSRRMSHDGRDACLFAVVAQDAGVQVGSHERGQLRQGHSRRVRACGGAVE